MDDFLTEEKVVELTGYERAADQSKWLSEQKILHFVNKQNKVKITWHAVNHPLYISSEEPDFDKVS